MPAPAGLMFGDLRCLTFRHFLLTLEAAESRRSCLGRISFSTEKQPSLVSLLILMNFCLLVPIDIRVFAASFYRKDAFECHSTSSNQLFYLFLSLGNLLILPAFQVASTNVAFSDTPAASWLRETLDLTFVLCSSATFVEQGSFMFGRFSHVLSCKQHFLAATLSSILC